jgi:hypothetical protein
VVHNGTEDDRKPDDYIDSKGYRIDPARNINLHGLRDLDSPCPPFLDSFRAADNSDGVAPALLCLSDLPVYAKIDNLLRL